MNQPDKPRTNMSAHGYHKETDILVIRFSRANLGLTHEKLNRDLQLLRTYQGGVGGVVIHNASTKLEGIIDFNMQQVDPDQHQQTKNELDAAIQTIELVQELHPGVIESLPILLQTKVEEIYTEHPDASTNWRKRFPGPPGNIFRSHVFHEWNKKIKPEESTKVVESLIEESLKLRITTMNPDLTERENLAYLTHHIWD